MPSHTPPADQFPLLLNRPADQRLREYQYRFAQSAVFGFPVILLQVVGHSLGGLESARWVAVFQGLLAGWVMYVGAAGMLFEGLLLLARRRFTADFLPAALAIGLYALGLWRAAPQLLRPASARPAPTFHLAVLTLLLWTAFRWHQLRRRLRAPPKQ